MSEDSPNRGSVLEKRIKQSRLSVSAIADLTKYSRTTFYRYFNGTAEVPSEVFAKVGKVIGHDFSIDLPELKHFLDNMVEESTVTYGDPSAQLENCKREKEKLQVRCMDLQEELNKYMRLYYEAELELNKKKK